MDSNSLSPVLASSQPAIKINQVEFNDLPRRPLEKIFSYLSLEDRIRLRAVSRKWCKLINIFRVKDLCLSERPSGFIQGKSRLVSGVFAHNYIGLPKFDLFFNIFGRSILSLLKHLRLCDLKLTKENGTAFSRTLHSLAQLQKLDLIRFSYMRDSEINLKVRLPMLQSIHLEDFSGIKRLTLDAARLQQVKACYCSVQLDLVHCESVEKLIVRDIKEIKLSKLMKLKNLKYLYCRHLEKIDSSFLGRLYRLEEIHLYDYPSAKEIFESKRLCGRAYLKIYFWGLLIHDLAEPKKLVRFDYHCDTLGRLVSSRESQPVSAPGFFNNQAFGYLAENHSRLANEIPFCNSLLYSPIERVAPESAINVLKRFKSLDHIRVDERVQDTQRFLNLLSELGHIATLEFKCGQSPDLFDRLPEHCALQKLTLHCEVYDFRFLFQLRHLTHLYLDRSIDAESIRKLLEELQFISRFEIKSASNEITIQIDDHRKNFQVFARGKWTILTDLNRVIQLII